MKQGKNRLAAEVEGVGRARLAGTPQGHGVFSRHEASLTLPDAEDGCHIMESSIIGEPKPPPFPGR